MNDREIVVGVSGGIAAYKSATLASRLVQAGARVSVVLTSAAEHFIAPATFEALTGRQVYRQMFEPSLPLGPHIELARRADVICVAPCTANVMAQAAHGIADDLLSTLLLSATSPIILAPAMNNEMWEKPSVQRNLATLREDGHHIVDPVEGWLSCRTRGVGRMAEPDTIFEAIASVFSAGT